MPYRHLRSLSRPALAALILLGLGAPAWAAGESGALGRIEDQGLTVDVAVEAADTQVKTLRAGDDARFRFTIRDTTTGEAVRGLNPSAWLDRQKSTDSGRSCTEKIAMFLQATLPFRPSIDLNRWFVVALNAESSVTVLDPIQGFSGRKLLALVPLDAPGEDWVLSPDGGRIFISLPREGTVAVVDTARWRVTHTIGVGPNPGRVALQPDGRYLWVGIEARADVEGKTGGVSVIDTETLEVVGRIATGAGHHDLAFDEASRHAFVTNSQDGTVTAIDVGRLTKLTDIRTGPRPMALAYSSHTESLHVADGAGGGITVIDGRSLEVAARIETGAALNAIRFIPGKRWGFALGRDDLLRIIDGSVNRIVQEIQTEPGADQIAFSEQYAYIRATGSAQVTMVPFIELGKEAAVPVVKVPGGQTPPGKAPYSSPANAIVPTPEPGAVIIANPADRTIYYYQEGMSAPIGGFDNERRSPKALLAVDNGLRETAPGVYTASARLPQDGSYDLAFILDTPRVSGCLSLAVQPGREASKRDTVKVDYLAGDDRLLAAVNTVVRFKLSNARTAEARTGAKDLRVLAVRGSGLWQRRFVARPLDDGLYEVEVTLPRPGRYKILLASDSLGIRYGKHSFIALDVESDALAGGQ